MSDKTDGGAVDSAAFEQSTGKDAEAVSTEMLRVRVQKLQARLDKAEQRLLRLETSERAYAKPTWCEDLDRAYAKVEEARAAVVEATGGARERLVVEQRGNVRVVIDEMSEPKGGAR